ncbi:putative pyruvate decarboxylase protein [Neofusicoccum parvum UCRNP2]|uniref:Putative pyruvate decarboxylase protein n=1 Tax=Botryosphaeria parva (strain UCR-NP2) TaxID=1287680 RepID=R1G8E1_BOTPV|nr:putative pyruvate decarboxylase protein [Neofusicoccum parvum UCRNP2]
MSRSVSPSLHIRADGLRAPNGPTVIEAILSALYSARNPVVIVDCLVARHRATPQARQLLDILRFPTFSTSMGKGIIDEPTPYFHGIYNGKVSHPGVAAAVEDASDLVLDLGPLLSDSNTGGHTRAIPPAKLVSLHPHGAVVRGQAFADAPIRAVLAALLAAVDPARLREVPRPAIPQPALDADAGSSAITQAWLWPRVGAFLRPGDVLLAESGTAQFGLPDAAFPERVTFVINNGGYTIERAIHGPDQEYNDIAAWNWQLMLEFFGDKDGKERSREARTTEELEAILALPEYTAPKSIQVLEVHMGRMDIPWRLQTQIDLIRARMNPSEKSQ